MDVQSYERTENALLTLKLIAQSQEHFRKARSKSHEEVESELEARLRD
jgi:hypothetical protein